ncbi:hypothetical protein TNCV_1650171 [Trichonephila clavipes]|nr:hypothetical protein TNCV_1650171 [Trichonephila clavipes]
MALTSTTEDFTYAENADMHYMCGYFFQRRAAVRSPSSEESIENVVVVRSESSTRAVAHHVSVNPQTVCTMSNENRLHLFHFLRVQALNPADYLLRLPVDGTAMCAAAGLHSSCAEQLL